MRRITIVCVTLAVLAAIGLAAAVWLIWFPPWGRSSLQPEPARLVTVAVSAEPSSLAWSADGSYIAAGTLGSSAGGPGTSQVFVVDVGRGIVAATLNAPDSVEGLAFSPDGKWLAVATSKALPTDPAPAELIVFDVPAFAERFRAKATGLDNGFIDLAWSADSRAVHAIDAPAVAGGKSEFRRWDVPAFNERPPIKIDGPAGVEYKALAPSPDGLVLAVAEQTAVGHLVVRLYNLKEGIERSSFKVGEQVGSPRLGFTTYGKTVGVFNGTSLSWWDVGTGRPVSPDKPRFAVSPAGLSHLRSRDSLSADGSSRARGYEHHRDFGDLGWDNRANEYGAFVEVTRTSPAKTWTWRVGSHSSAPAVAFSPDGSKVAGTVQLPTGNAVVVWSVPN